MEETNRLEQDAGRAEKEIAAIQVARMSEKILQRQIAELLHHHGIVVFYQRMDRRTSGEKGQPDFLFSVNGQAVAWEIKTETGRLSLEQERLMDKLSQPPNSWKCKVIRSVEEAIHQIALIRR